MEEYWPKHRVQSTEYRLGEKITTSLARAHRKGYSITKYNFTPSESMYFAESFYYFVYKPQMRIDKGEIKVLNKYLYFRCKEHLK